MKTTFGFWFCAIAGGAVKTAPMKSAQQSASRLFCRFIAARPPSVRALSIVRILRPLDSERTLGGGGSNRPERAVAIEPRAGQGVGSISLGFQVALKKGSVGP
jgi:hypothetical protein